MLPRISTSALTTPSNQQAHLTTPPSPSSVTTVWQWNCRGLKRKLSSLKTFIQTRPTPPDLILLQEAFCLPRIPGYVAYHTGNPTEPSSLCLITLIASHLPFTPLTDPLPSSRDFMAHGVVVSFTTHLAPMHIINVYHRPGKQVPPLDSLFPTSTRQTPPRLVLGDFNCPHPIWGYPRIGVGGRALADIVQQKAYSLLTDPLTPTRVGHSAARDSTPDLAFYTGAGSPTWSHTHEFLGSDHAILEICLHFTRLRRRAPRPTKLTDWHAFRQACFPLLTPRTQIRGFSKYRISVSDTLSTSTRTLKPPTSTLTYCTYGTPVALFIGVGAAKNTTVNCAFVSIG